MSIMSLFRARKAEATGDVYAIAKRIADGETPDLDRIQATCFHADMSIVDFDALVELCRERRRLREQAARLPGIQAERDEIQKKIDAANATLQEVETAYRKKMASVQRLKDAIDGQHYAASSALNALADDANLPETLVTARKAAKSRMFAASDSLRDAESKLDAAERALKRAKEKQAQQPRRNPRVEGDWRGQGDLSEDDAGKINRDLYSLPIQITNIKEKLPQLRQEHADAEKALAAVEKQCASF
jgi:chromosome segregation ATPase